MQCHDIFIPRCQVMFLQRAQFLDPIHWDPHLIPTGFPMKRGKVISKSRENPKWDSPNSSRISVHAKKHVTGKRKKNLARHHNMTVSIHIQTNHSCHEQSCVSPSSITNMNMICNCTKPVRHNYQSSIPRVWISKSSQFPCNF